MSVLGQFDITGKVGIVTGAASGIGLAIADALAESGVRIGLLDRDAEGLEGARRRLAATGAEVVSKAVDMSDRDQARHAIDAVVEHYGRLDITFGNAGISGKPGFARFDGSRDPAGELDAVTDEDWDRVLAVNLNSVFATIQRSAFHMKKTGAGRIIITTSVAAFRNQGWVGTPYMPSKAGAAHLVRQAALELARYNITVNAIAPGAFATNIGGGRMKSAQAAEIMAKRIPLGRIAQPEEVKGLALFLASPASGFITGVQVPIDGGSSLGA